MDTLIRLQDLTFRFQGNRLPILQGVTLTVRSGERILIRGRSGSGKSTLLALMAGLAPEYIVGELSGERELMYNLKGVVLQNPEAQIVTPTVREEIAFALENQGMDPVQILKRVDETMTALGIENLGDRHPLGLSGGECQRVSLAAALALRPDILFLDEPTSYLDDESSQRFFRTLQLLSPQTAIVVVEHRLDLAARICHRAYQVEPDGRVVESDFSQDHLLPPRRREGVDGSRDGSIPSRETPVLEIRNLSHRWRGAGSAGGDRGLLGGFGNRNWRDHTPEGEGELFREVSLTINPGEIVALLGPSGCGKTTLLGKISGRIPVEGGRVFFQGKDITELPREEFYRFFMYVPQNPEHMFLCESVREELGEQPEQRGAFEIATRFGLGQKLEAHPFRLSEGEKRRLNLAVAFASRRTLYLLDEPTYGLDVFSKSILVEDLRTLAEGGASILLVTHDGAFAEATANILYKFKDQRLIREETRELIGTPA